MRILYIYKDYFGRRKLYGKYMRECGHKVIYMEKKHKQDVNNIKVEEIRRVKPDLIWFLNGFYLKYNPIVSDYIQSKKIPIVFYHGVSGRFPYVDWLDIWKKFTIIFPVAYDFHEYLIANGINSYYMPFAFHPMQYFKTIGIKKYNVSFAGTIDTKIDPKNDNRCRYLNSLKNINNVVAFSRTFKNKLNKKIFIKACITHEQQRDAYAKSKINLDLPFVSGGCSFFDKRYHFRNRFFEIPATCNFMLTVKTKEFLDIFDEDTIGYYDDNLDSFVDSVKRYLRDDKIRDSMAKKSYKLVHEKHTFLHRFKKMFQIIGENI